jgi:hypothetical protein
MRLHPQPFFQQRLGQASARLAGSAAERIEPLECFRLQP